MKAFPRHGVLLTALQYTTSRTAKSSGLELANSRAARVAATIVTSRQALNATTPILLGENFFVCCGPTFLSLLIEKCDTSRFATRICLGGSIDSKFAQTMIQQCDFVLTVIITATSAVDDDITPILMSLPHLRDVRFRVVTGPPRVVKPRAMTFHGTLRPLLKHPTETVRRTIATHIKKEWFVHFSPQQRADFFRDDLIPLIDSATNNASVYDCFYPGICLVDWSFLPRDTITMLCDRAHQFLTSPSTQPKLRERSLAYLTRCARAPQGGTDLVFDGYNVLSVLPQMIRDGRVSPRSQGCARFLKMIYEKATPAQRKQVDDLGLLDCVYDAFVHPPQHQQHIATASAVTNQQRVVHDAFGLMVVYRDEHDNDDGEEEDDQVEKNGDAADDAANTRFPLLDRRLKELFDAAAKFPDTFLSSTRILQKELHRVLIPWHRGLMARSARMMKQRGMSSATFLCYTPFNPPAYGDAVLRSVSLIVKLLAAIVDQKADLFMNVVRMLFDEYRGLYVGPILRTFVLTSVHKKHNTDIRDITGILWKAYASENAMSNESINSITADTAATTTHHRRRDREEDDQKGDEHAGGRRYLAEFMSDPAIDAILRPPPRCASETSSSDFDDDYYDDGYDYFDDDGMGHHFDDDDEEYGYMGF